MPRTRRLSETYHPPRRFWAFQGTETTIFFALAAALVAIVILRVKRLG